MAGELGTTNLLLGILAAVSVLEALAIIGLGIAAFQAYRRIMELVAGIETRQVAPAMARVNAILDDVKAESATVKAETDLRLLVIDRTHFWRLLKEVPGLTEKILVTLSRRVRQVEEPRGT